MLGGQIKDNDIGSSVLTGMALRIRVLDTAIHINLRPFPTPIPVGKETFGITGRDYKAEERMALRILGSIHAVSVSSNRRQYRYISSPVLSIILLLWDGRGTSKLHEGVGAAMGCLAPLKT